VLRVTDKTELPPEAEDVLKKVEEEQKKKTADKLIELAVSESYHDDGASEAAGGLFHTADAVAYADIEFDGRRETWPVRSRGFKHWLVRIFYEVEGTAPNSEALQTALLLCEARARFDGVEREVYVRVGGAGGRIYLDLADEHWRAIEIAPTGWRMLESKQVPVRFRRAPGMLPLPVPLTGGTVAELRTFLNVKSDDDFELAIAWLLAAMRDRGPYPVLALMGEQGSAKTSFATIVRSHVDPNTAALRSFPREDRDLFIAASNGWVVPYDNVSRIPAWLSDALCRLSTGGGFSTRKLYTDDEEQLFNAQRPVILNGIEDFVERPDLADRAIFLTLEPIPEDQRKADQALQDEVARAKPMILGALLDRLVVGLQRLPRTKLDRLPRMADFALWATACEISPGAFMRAYESNRASAVEVVLEADLVAGAVRKLMADGPEWSGTAAELLSALTEFVDENLRRGRDWPTAANVLAGRLRRAATNLRKVGIEVRFERRPHIGTRVIRITTRPDKARERPSPPSPSPVDGKSASRGNGLGGDDAGDDGVTMVTMDRHPTVTAKPLKNNGGDDGDDGDDFLRTQSSDEPVCRRCGIPGNDIYGQLIRAGRDGAAGHYHPRCWTEERTRGPRPSPARRPALGPEGGSLDDLK
jgi:hypothetical protein